MPGVKLSGYLTKTILSGSMTAKVSKDQLYCFLNGRPIDMPKKIKNLLSELYRRYNVSSAPIVVLKLLVEDDNYDINAAPDKREVFIQNEKEMLPKLRVKLDEFFERICRQAAGGGDAYRQTDFKRGLSQITGASQDEKSIDKKLKSEPPS